MNCKTVRELLDDYLDGELAAGEAEAMRGHLLGCADCRREHEALADLVRQAGGMDRDRAPSRDLWPGIRERISAARAGGRADRPWIVVAAAAVLFLAVLLGPVGPDRPGSEPSPGGEPAGYLEADRKFSQFREEMLRDLSDGSARYDAGAVRLVKTGLGVMDDASAEIRKALAADPGNPGLRRMLLASYRHEARLLSWIREYPDTTG